MIEIIDNLHLGSNLPLDARYYVDTIYDVSMYWYTGMQMYDSSTGRAWVVKDVSLAAIEEILLDYNILDGGNNWSNSGDIVDGGEWPTPGGWTFFQSQIIELEN